MMMTANALDALESEEVRMRLKEEEWSNEKGSEDNINKGQERKDTKGGVPFNFRANSLELTTF